MNLIEGHIAGGRFEAPGLSLPVEAGERGDVVLGIRPEEPGADDH